MGTPDSRLDFQCGYTYYWSPELYDKNYGTKADVWSIGIVLCLLIDGRFPFKTEHDVRERLVELKTIVSADCSDIVLGMLEKLETRRLSSAEVKSHLWLSIGEDV